MFKIERKKNKKFKFIENVTKIKKKKADKLFIWSTKFYQNDI